MASRTVLPAPSAPGDAFYFYTANEIEPRGWLRNQLRIQAEGLAGNLDKMWPSVRDSKWIGGNSDGWERVPCWLDGFLPLAYLLRDEEMIARAQRYMDYILEHQREDGWICPCTDEEREKYDLWAVELFSKIICLYGDCSGDPRAEEALCRMLKNFSGHLKKHELKNWGYARWFETFIAIEWLRQRRPEESGWLLELASTLQRQGLDYVALCDNWPYQQATGDYKYESHVVDMGMALRAGCIVDKVLPSQAQSGQPRRILELLRRYHGMAYGHFAGSEHLAGLSPIQGTELCGVVEAMYSEEIQLATTGKAGWGDWLERLAFNGLPATCSPDMWTHQYLQQPNQTSALEQPKKLWTTNWKDGGRAARSASSFGLEPYYGCCTANHGHGWPKLALSTFMRARDGIFSAVLAPAKLNTVIDGVEVSCELRTRYPFGDRLEYVVECAQPVEFTLHLRVPGFASAALVDGVKVPVGEVAQVRRRWEGRSVVTVELSFEAQLVDRPYGGLKALMRGPLLYALPIASEWKRVEYGENPARKFPYCDYDITPKGEWNFAFDGAEFKVEYCDEAKALEMPFNEELPPIAIRAKMAPVDWRYKEGFNMICNEFPESTSPIGETREMRLIPYGCTTLRMTEMPMADK